MATRGQDRHGRAHLAFGTAEHCLVGGSGASRNMSAAPVHGYRSTTVAAGATDPQRYVRAQVWTAHRWRRRQALPSGGGTVIAPSMVLPVSAGRCTL